MSIPDNGPQSMGGDETRFRVALAQISPRLGDIEANLKTHLEWIQRAASDGADLIVFPELSLTGYYLRDLVPQAAIRPDMDDPVFAQLLSASHAIDIAVGFVCEDERHRFTIAAAYLSSGELLHLHHKVYLPTYRLFDDARFFGAGDQLRAFDTRFGRMGFLICEDAWHLSSGVVLWQDGADIILHIAANPGYGVRADLSTLANTDDLHLINRAYAELLTVWVVHVNRVGVEDGVTFFGHSSVTAPDGRTAATAPLLEEALVPVTIDRATLRHARATLPILRDEKLDLVIGELERVRQSNW
ncbi:MAG: carbon-nitrogen hydrolase [Chloroflexi bacterium]|nr:carbon-nitrogen hydrolase [Chloroflexota bacterium]